MTRKIIVGMVAGPSVLMLLAFACFLAACPGGAARAANHPSDARAAATP